jgi:hypothetical protein
VAPPGPNGISVLPHDAAVQVREVSRAAELVIGDVCRVLGQQLDGPLLIAARHRRVGPRLVACTYCSHPLILPAARMAR